MSQALNIIFAGTPDFAASALKSLLASEHKVCAVYTQPDRPAGRGRKLKASPVKELALEADIPVHQPTSLKDPAEQEKLRELNADLMVVVAYGLLLPPEVLSATRLGCINIHASLLPRWRGAAPIQRAILAGDEKTGITIMQMDAGLDTGDMLHVVTTPIHPEDTAQTLHDRLAELGAEALLDTLGQIADGTVEATPQDDSQANYAKKMDKAEAVMDWSRPAHELDRQVHAFNPWPVTQTTLNGKVLRVWDSILAEKTTDATPGSVIHADKHGIDVATGDGVLRLTRVQIAGGKPLDAAAFINGHPQLKTGGIRLGDKS